MAHTRDARSTISVIIVAGACGIAAGTPLALLGAIGRSAREGAIVKGGRYLEVLATVDTVVLDKTGTLTFGTPEVVCVHPVDGLGEDELVAAAAIAERRSEHPLGKAIVRNAELRGVTAVEPHSFAYAPGLGIRATIGSREILVGNRALLAGRGLTAGASASEHHEAATEVLVAEDGRYLGALAVRDTLRPEAREAIGALHALGIRTVLLTGDAGSTATVVARELGVDEVEAELLPEEKLARVEALVAAGRRVAMVGDVARESADVVLLGNDLLKLVETLRIARKTRRIIYENFIGTISVDTIGIVLAAFGFLNPLLAAFIHVASELTFILNSTRMLPSPRR